ncbi:MAG: phage holin [Anaerovorax sp.]|nr:phage holin [Anaerovorax sp.]
MKINWRVRVRNPVFLAQIICAIFGPILAYFGIMWEEITTWERLFKVLVQALQNPVVVVAVFLSMINAITDPTTKGIGDSIQAGNYIKPK